MTERIEDRIKFAIGALSSAEKDAALNLAGEEISNLRGALKRIEKWFGEFPETGEFWDGDESRPMSYGVLNGSNGERDYMRAVARQALGEKL